MSLASELNTAEEMITKLIKDDIVKKGLVDTGTLRDSISTSVTISNQGEMKITVLGEDYFDELDEKYNIVDDALNSSTFTQIENALSIAYGTFLEQQLK